MNEIRSLKKANAVNGHGQRGMAQEKIKASNASASAAIKSVISSLVVPPGTATVIPYMPWWSNSHLDD